MKNTNKFYQEIANLMTAIDNCIKTKNTAWLDNYTKQIQTLVKDRMPSGNGFTCYVDGGTKIDIKKSNRNKLVFYTEFHHMNEAGMYDGWTKHIITVKPDLLSGINLMISGKDRNNIKDYIYEIFYSALQTEWE